MNTLRVVCIVALSCMFAGLNGCASNRADSDSAEIVEGGISQAEMDEIERARARGVAIPEALDAVPLDDPARAAVQASRDVRTIYFEYDSDTVREEFRAAIEAHAAYLASRPDTVVTLEGHADERGSREYNLALGERRAISVRRLMVLLGAGNAQLRTVSMGEERPAADGHDESSYGLNRRVEIIY